MTNKNLWCLIYKSIPLVFDNSLSYMEIQAKILDYINKLKNDIISLSDEIDNLNVDEIIQAVNNEIEEFINEVNKMMNDYQVKTENELNNFKNYINKDISDFKIAINELVKKDPTLCMDPITGKIEDTCTIFQDIYNAMQIDALSCQEFDKAQKITCNYFDDSNITALEYDLKSKTILL